MRSSNTLSNTLSLLLAIAALTVTTVGFAQEKIAPPATPARGSTMDSVKAQFGTPTQETPAVGQPPITRWEYPGYVVYFEHDKVLHTVVAR